MKTNGYAWEEGAVLEDHTKKKHEILGRYFKQYLITRCQLPKQEKFRLVIVDGFAGAGLYRDGSFGSPLIFVDVLKNAIQEINLARFAQGINAIHIECLLILNDIEKSTIDLLCKNLTPYILSCSDASSNLQIQVEYYSYKFDTLYPKLKERLASAKCGNVLFNLDQCGYSQVTTQNIRDMITSWRSAEVILTFMIDSMLAYLSPNKNLGKVPLEPELQSNIDEILKSNLVAKSQWLGEAERKIYAYYRGCAPFVSPFSINNPNGWRYWLMHFANSFRARQVYNNILHQDGQAQAHFGRAGLKMLSYDPANEGKLYLFNESSRQFAREELYDDIPRMISESGDSLSVEEFYEAAYSETPAHSDDINEMIFMNPDVEVISASGGKRRNTLKIGDTLRLKTQKSLLFKFS